MSAAPKNGDPGLQQVYRDRVECVPDWIWEVDTDGIVTYSNQVVEELLGYPVSEVVNRCVFDLLAPGEVERCRLLFESAKNAGEEIRNVTSEFSRSDGAFRTLEVSCVPIRDDSGGVTGYRGIGRDVTEQLFLRKAAREAQEQYKAVVDNAPTGIFIVQDGVVVFANPAICVLMGYPMQEAVGLSIWQVVHPEDRSWLEDYYRRRVAGEQVPTQYEARGITKDGEVRHFDFRASLIHYEGKPAVLLNAVDITERKAADAERKASESKLRGLLRAAPIGVGVVSNRVILWTNDRMTEMTGYSYSELAGSTARILYESDEEFERVGRVKYADIAERGVGAVETRWRCKDGRLIDILLSSAALDPDTTPPEYVFTASDITERKLAEENRRQMQRDLDAQKKQFYRDTIRSVTEGKLEICDRSEMRAYTSGGELELEVSSTRDAAPTRRRLREFCAAKGLHGDRLESFIVGVGEALTNAIKHGVRGHVRAGVEDGAVWVAVVDNGRGIDSVILPHVTLMRGFSTKRSLGLGYSIMLEVADRIMLSTGGRGTVVALFKNITEPVIRLSVDDLPDTWRNIPD